MSVRIQIDSNAAAVLRQVQGFPPRLAQATARAMDLENELTVAHAQSAYLSGPRPLRLGVVTNRLRSSIRRAKAVVTGNSVESSIGTNVKYAGVHERGFDGNVTIRQHVARNAWLDVFSVKGRTVQGWELTGTGAKRAKRLASGVATIRAHTRHMKIPARPFLAPALADRTSNYSASISAAIIEAWGKSGS